MILRVIALIALILFIVFHVLKTMDHFRYDWIWVFAPLLYAYAIHLAASIRLK